MGFDLEQICCDPPSSSSSTTNIFCNENYNKCSPCCCHSCCKKSFLNDHTYSILKRVCHKIIKNYNRQQCREKYTVFNGGNSINPISSDRQRDGSEYINQSRRYDDFNGINRNRLKNRGDLDELIKRDRNKSYGKSLKEKDNGDENTGKSKQGKGRTENDKGNSLKLVKGDKHHSEKIRGKQDIDKDNLKFKKLDDKKGEKLTEGTGSDGINQNNAKNQIVLNSNREKGTKSDRSGNEKINVDKSGKKNSSGEMDLNAASLRGDKVSRGSTSISEKGAEGDKTGKGNISGVPNKKGKQPTAGEGDKTGKGHINGVPNKKVQQPTADEGDKTGKGNISVVPNKIEKQPTAGEKDFNAKSEPINKNSRASEGIAEKVTKGNKKGTKDSSNINDGQESYNEQRRKRKRKDCETKEDELTRLIRKNGERKSSRTGFSKNRSRIRNDIRGSKFIHADRRPGRNEVRACDILRVHLEERDLSRCVPCQPNPCQVCKKCMPTCMPTSILW